MKGQRGDETDDGFREPQAHRDQVRVAEGRQFRQPVDAPAHRLQNTPVPKRIECVARDPACQGLAHAELAAVPAEDIFGLLLHGRASDKLPTLKFK